MEENKPIIYVWRIDFEYRTLPPDVAEENQSGHYFSFAPTNASEDEMHISIPKLENLALLLSHQHKEHPLRFEVHPELGHFQQTEDYEIYRKAFTPEEQKTFLEILRAN